MKNRNVPFSILASAALCATWLMATTPTAHATTLMHMSIAKMSQKAPLIVRARCLGNATSWDAGDIWTFTSFSVEEAWKGTAPQEIVVRLLGGSAGSITSNVSGIPHFRPGEEVILFLEPTPRGDFSVVSWQQGTFRIHRDSVAGRETVTQDTASFATFDPATHRFQAAGARNLPLEALRAQVDAALLNASPERKP